MTEPNGTDPASDVRPRPVNAEIAAEWRAFFAKGGEFAVPTAPELARRRMRSNTIALVVFVAVAIVAVIGAVALAATEVGRVLTYVVLAALLIALVAAYFKVFFIRRRMRAVLASPQEYFAVLRDGVRFSGVSFPWADLVGGLVIDERTVAVPARQRLTAKLSYAVGYSRADVLLGVRAGTVRAFRERAPGDVRKAFFVSFEDGGIRVPLENAIDDESISALITALRVSASDAGVDVITSVEPTVISSTMMAIYRGQRPGAAKGVS